MVLNQALTRAGYEVRPTGNLSTMWNWVSRGEGDVLITDVAMPDGNAFDIMPKIKKLRPDLPVIVMSAQNTFMTAIRANRKSGAYEYLPKPFDIAEVLSVVARALADAKKPRAAEPPAEEPGETHAAGRPFAGHAGHLPGPGAADADRPDGDDHRRERHRQGTGGAGAARFRQAPQRPVRRHQHGRHSARPDRGGTVRPREGRLYRRHVALVRPLRAGRGRHAVSRRDRRHADGRPDPPAARAAGGRVHHGRRAHADQDQRAHRRRHAPRPQPDDPAGPVPRGPLLPAQRRADPPAAAARAHRRHRRSGAAFPARGPARGRAGQDHLARRASS